MQAGPDFGQARFRRRARVPGAEEACPLLPRTERKPLPAFVPNRLWRKGFHDFARVSLVEGIDAPEVYLMHSVRNSAPRTREPARTMSGNITP